MDKKELKKRCNEGNVCLTPTDLARWAEFYRSHLIDELYAVEKSLTVLSWISTEEEIPLRLDRETISKAAETLMRTIAFRHSEKTFEDGDYSALIKNTDGDFFGGVYIRDLVYTLDTLASLMSSDQDQQG